MAFYLKYRPQTIGELDIAPVREGLYGMLRSKETGRLPHALLFAGPRGTGKTSSARILAKAINCEGAVSKFPSFAEASAGRQSVKVSKQDETSERDAEVSGSRDSGTSKPLNLFAIYGKK
jgi:DNA polymerase III gamma/tau subunit